MTAPGTQAPPPMVHQRPPEPRQVPPRKRDVPSCLSEIKDALLGVERAYAGYNHLSEILAQLSGQAPEGARLKGMPIFKYFASPDGVKQIEVQSDLGTIPLEYRNHVLVPMVNGHAIELNAALAVLASVTQEMQAIIGPLVSGTAPL